MLFVMKYADEPETRWRALHAKDRPTARAQALAVAGTEWVEYGVVDRVTGVVELLGCVRNESPSRVSTVAASV